MDPENVTPEDVYNEVKKQFQKYGDKYDDWDDYNSSSHDTPAYYGEQLGLNTRSFSGEINDAIQATIDAAEQHPNLLVYTNSQASNRPDNYHRIQLNKNGWDDLN